MWCPSAPLFPMITADSGRSATKARGPAARETGDRRRPGRWMRRRVDRMICVGCRMAVGLKHTRDVFVPKLKRIV